MLTKSSSSTSFQNLDLFSYNNAAKFKWSPNGVVIRNGIGFYDNHSSAILDVYSKTKGVLLTRHTTAEMLAVPNPANGLVTYNTDSLAYCYFNGTAWLKMGSGGGTPASTSYTASGGITLSGSDFKLGGTLSEHTTINGGNNFNITLDSLNSLNVSSRQGSVINRFKIGYVYTNVLESVNATSPNIRDGFSSNVGGTGLHRDNNAGQYVNAVAGSWMRVKKIK